jgi:hypothetical protein
LLRFMSRAYRRRCSWRSNEVRTGGDVIFKHRLLFLTHGWRAVEYLQLEQLSMP